MPTLTEEDVRNKSDEHLLKMFVINLQFATMLTLEPFVDAAMADYKVCEAEILSRMSRDVPAQ